ncbi:MAG: amidohydrolase family protein [Bdellovibrionales bacterium]|nr:amidohydrolase family protein [Bdellovibrionales bacterium]
MKELSNRLNLDFRSETSTRFPFTGSIIDVHSHINGPAASVVYGEAAKLFGIELTYSMSQLEEVPALQEKLGDSIRFIAFPKFLSDNPIYEHSDGYIRRIEEFHKLGSRIVKFWAAPRGLDYGKSFGNPDILRLNSPERLACMEAAADLGMYFMTHVSDPDTWFQAKYSDPSTYGTKLDQYEPLEELLEKFKQPWIAAHMAGWPENLEFLDGLLSRHENLYLDTSATKWMVRELSKHPREEVVAFFSKWKKRLLFGSDIVTTDAHLDSSQNDHFKADQAKSREEAFDLYASRYWALRTLFETSYSGESPISDSDLHMVNPQRFQEEDAPTLSGKGLPSEVLEWIYSRTAKELLEPLHT